jgi:hypothetical protein
MDSDFAKNQKTYYSTKGFVLSSEEGLYHGYQKDNRLLRYQQ